METKERMILKEQLAELVERKDRIMLMDKLDCSSIKKILNDIDLIRRKLSLGQ